MSADLIEFVPSYSAALGERFNALGAGGREFESRRPDQRKQLIYLQCRGSSPASAPVATCGVWGLLEALDSYNFDYNGLG